MNDLIRRSDAIQAFDELLKSPYASNKDPFGRGIRDALKLARDMMKNNVPKSLSIPAVDAVEKRRGRWEGNYPRAMFRLKRCSVCETLAPEGWYCFFCGAKMDGCREDGDNGKHL